MVRVLEWCFSGVGTSRLHFYTSPTAPAGHGLLLGFDVNWGGSRQPRCTFKIPSSQTAYFTSCNRPCKANGGHA